MTNLSSPLWLGKQDREESELAIRWHNKVTKLAVDDTPGTCLVGFPCDLGVRKSKGRHGAAKGPEAIRRVLANLAWHLDTPVYDAGNLDCEWFELAKAQQDLGIMVNNILKQGHFPIILGGGQELAFGGYQGLEQHLDAGQKIGVINFDTHFDIRSDQDGGSSGSQFFQIMKRANQQQRHLSYLCLGVSKISNSQALFARAREFGVQYKYDTDLHWNNIDTIKAGLRSFISEVDAIYVSIDLAVLPAYIAPGVSAPAAYGMPLELLEHLLITIKKNARSKLKLADICEYNPNFDQDNRTANVAARLISQLAK
ncbi:MULTISPECIES: formimidoylglutamase [unclassified Motilimonas]|uniref:formimidoylglutamase n=1 Tax=Motilimonas TaxID=1914248 RepID=UPI001E4C712D|nr:MULTISPECIES: formimidoylglutamase [unclassified Motilimonas]MCE0557073.1 formimidoylglutamase [Motilimonas sp. E26]MDO6524305.1 formimidoylglutamase [Motilimonas sp. 1_MG-2023]